MAQNQAFIMRVMASSLNIAEKAGEIIRDVMQRGELGVVDKVFKRNSPPTYIKKLLKPLQGENKQFDPQTEADRSSQKCIVASLTKQYSNLKIIGEEGQLDLNNVSKDFVVDSINEDFLSNHKCPESLKSIKEEDVVVWVDPLDGTSEFIHGHLEHVTVLIGIAFNNSPVAGIIHQPYFKCPDSGKLGRNIWGIQGLGIGGCTSKKPEDGKFIITTTRSHSNELVQATLDAINPTEVLRVGGCGFKVLQLLEGSAHCYVFASNGCKKWDTCAPEAIIEADGGKLTDICGSHYGYNADIEFANKTGVLSTSKFVSHEDLMKKIPKSVGDKLTSKY